MMTLKHYAGKTAPYVVLLERSEGQELWVRYVHMALGWKVYRRGEGGGALGWELWLEAGVPCGRPGLYATERKQCNVASLVHRVVALTGPSQSFNATQASPVRSATVRT